VLKSAVKQNCKPLW